MAPIGALGRVRVALVLIVAASCAPVRAFTLLHGAPLRSTPLHTSRRDSSLPLSSSIVFSAVPKECSLPTHNGCRAAYSSPTSPSSSSGEAICIVLGSRTELAPLVHNDRSARQHIRACAGPPTDGSLAWIWEQRKADGSLLDILPRLFPFALDDFQLQALAALHAGQSVVVSAPTGCGKTAIAELAMYLALAAGERAVYTTPLKALSNQKYDELSRKFGRQKVGLLTGDSRLNRGGDVLVMTTEVYRNMLLDPEEGSEAALARVGVVVLDEFHYMNDRQRGTVWEECCILAPPSSRIVALSATMANAAQIASWFKQIHGDTALVSSSFRPVPLRFYFSDSVGIDPLYTTISAGPGGSGSQRRRQWKLNPALRPEVRAAERDRKQLKETPRDSRGDGRGSRGQSGGRGGGGRDGGWGRGQGRAGSFDRGVLQTERQLARAEVPSMPFLLRCLSRKDMLPAIVFIFSRAGCDEAAAAVAAMRMPLVSSAEAREVTGRVAEWRTANWQLPVDEDRLHRLRLGIASHHAGMLPLEKALVESLFQANLLKVVFATETLAAGINMPARSTVISVLSKRGDMGIAPLSASQLLQMAGRAGRRGLDEIGNVVLCRSPFEGSEQAVMLLARPADRIESHFFVSYGSALKMLRVRTLNECRRFVSSSFGSFTDTSARRAESERLRELRLERQQLRPLLSRFSTGEVRAYVKLGERLKAEQRSLNYLREQAAADAAELVQVLISFVPMGTCARTGDGALAAIVDDAPPAVRAKLRSDTETSEEVVLLVLRDRSVRCVGTQHLAELYPELLLQLSREEVQQLIEALPKVGEWQQLDDGSFALGADGVACTARDAIASRVPSSPPVSDEHPGVSKQVSRVERALSQLQAHPLHGHVDRDELLIAGERDGLLQEEERRLLRKLPKRLDAGDGSEGRSGEGATTGRDEGSESSWEQFKCVGNLLREYGALDGWTPTDFGELIAELSGENELWLALVLVEVTASSAMSPLSPAQLAAVLAATLDERLRPNAFVAFDPSEGTVETIDILLSRAGALQQAQLAHGLTFPVGLEVGMCGLVEAWARGTEWAELLRGTTLDAGDIYRLLRRTLELLRQVAFVPYVSEQARRNARIALDAVNRYPIADGALMALADSEEEEDGQQQREMRVEEQHGEMLVDEVAPAGEG